MLSIPGNRKLTCEEDEMGPGYDHDEFMKHWKGGLSSLKGQTVYDPMTQNYIPVPPSAMPSNPPAGLSQPGPNSTEQRLAHIQLLVAAGSITAQEGAEARDRVLRGM